MKIKEQAIQIRCLPEYKARIREVADYMNMSVSGWIIMLINKEFEREDAK